MPVQHGHEPFALVRWATFLGFVKSFSISRQNIKLYSEVNSASAKLQLYRKNRTNMGKDKGEKKDTFVYVHDKEFAWVPARLIETKGDKAVVSIPKYANEQAIVSDGGRSGKGVEERTVNLKDYPHKVLPLQNVDGKGNLHQYADMVHLPYLHEVSHCSQACGQKPQTF
jgi:hypothetical protein